MNRFSTEKCSSRTEYGFHLADVFTAIRYSKCFTLHLIVSLFRACIELALQISDASQSHRLDNRVLINAILRTFSSEA